MIGVIVAMHADLAEALLKTASSVLKRDPDQFAAVSIRPGDDASSFLERLRASVKAVERGYGVVILTDMFGGTPSTVGMSLHEAGKVEVLTGANLPMVLKALQLSAQADVALMELARQVKDAGQRSITLASDVLYGMEPSALFAPKTEVNRL